MKGPSALACLLRPKLQWSTVTTVAGLTILSLWDLLARSSESFFTTLPPPPTRRAEPRRCVMAAYAGAHEPYGCQYRTIDRDILFNHFRNGDRQMDRREICKKTGGNDGNGGTSTGSTGTSDENCDPYVVIGLTGACSHVQRSGSVVSSPILKSGNIVIAVGSDHGRTPPDSSICRICYLILSFSHPPTHGCGVDVGIIGSGYCEDYEGLSRLGSVAECKEAYDMRDTWQFEEHGRTIKDVVDEKAKWTGKLGREWNWMAGGCVVTDDAKEVYFNAHEQPLHSTGAGEERSRLLASASIVGTRQSVPCHSMVRFAHSPSCRTPKSPPAYVFKSQSMGTCGSDARR